ncbi:hypothetical protein Tco_0791172 [Tanacetum coccineum]
MELQDSTQSNNWSDVLSLYFWRAKEANLRMARMINNVSVKLRAVIEEYQLFTQELEASPGWVVNKDRSIEYLQELVQRDEEMVQRLQALEREVEERADEKMLFIEKLKGNVVEDPSVEDGVPSSSFSSSSSSSSSSASYFSSTSSPSSSSSSSFLFLLHLHLHHQPAHHSRTTLQVDMVNILANGDVQCANCLRVDWQLGIRPGDFYGVVRHE